MNRREMLGRLASLPFIGGVGAALAARPQVITYDPLKRAIEWASEMGWKVWRYPATDPADGWYGWIEGRGGTIVGWIATSGDVRIALK